MMLDWRRRLAAWAKRLKRDVLALWLASRDARVPFLAKAVAWLVAAYALSPIDLIPDFVPVLGYLDDLILIPAGIALAIRLVPAPLMVEFRAEASRRVQKPSSRVGAIAILVLWLAALALTAKFIGPLS